MKLLIVNQGNNINNYFKLINNENKIKVIIEMELITQ